MLIALSVLPAALLMIFIWRRDKIEKEPLGLLIGLFFLGALTVFPAAFIELGLGKVLESFAAEGSTEYIVIENFLIVALAEEGCKFTVLRLKTWRHPAFNYTFDAIVYAVFTSLGFATLENVLYVVSSGTIGIAIMRGILSVPGHAIDAVFMGWCYGLAKRAECSGELSKKSSYLRRALLAPVLIHGFYDFSLSMEQDYFLILFFAFEIIITIIAFRKVHELSRNDEPLPIGTPFGVYVRSGTQQYQNPYIYQQYGQPRQYQQPGPQYTQYPQYTQPGGPYQNPYQQQPPLDSYAQRLYEEEQKR